MDCSSNIFFSLLESKGSQAAFNYMASCMPDYVYKFISLTEERNNNDVSENEKRFKSLSENKVWFSLRTALNDPYEMKGLYFDRSRLLQYGISQEYVDQLEEIMYNTALASFTGNIEDNLPMWAHYSNNHQGYAIKYRVTNKHVIRPVIYEEKIINASNILINFLHNAIEFEKTQENETQKALDLFSTILQFSFLIKHSSWSYEKEYRIVYPLIHDKSVGYGLNVDTSVFGFEPIAIYSGINCNDVHKQRLQGIARELGIEFYCCKQSNTKFTVVE